MIEFEISYNNITTKIKSPIGWQSLAYQLVRDEVYNGIDLNVTAELTFIDDGFDILNQFIHGRDFDANLTLHLWYNDSLIKKFKINLFDHRLQSRQIEVSVTQISFSQALKNRENLTVNLYTPNNIDGDLLTPVTLLGSPFFFSPIPIFLNSKLENLTNFDFFKEEPNFDLSFTGLVFYRGIPQLEVVLGEIQNTYTGGSSTQFVTSALATPIEPYYIDTLNQQHPDIINEYLVEYDLSGDIGDFCSVVRARQVDWEINLYHGTRDNLTKVNLDSGFISGSSNFLTDTYSIVGSQILVLIPANAVIFIVAEIKSFFSTGAPGPNHVFQQGLYSSNWTIEVNQESLLLNTEHKATPVYEFVNRCLENITGRNDVLRSDYYGRTNSEPTPYPTNGLGSFKALTNGFNIRGFDEQVDQESPDYKPPLIKWSDLFDSLNAIDNLGVDVGSDYVRLEPKAYFYNNNLIKNLGEIKDITFSIKRSLYFNEAQIGYDDWEDFTEEGLSEFASNRTFTNRIKNNGQPLNLKSKIVASSFAIELTRRQNKIYQPRSKSKWDSSIFVIETSKRLDSFGQPFVNSPNVKVDFTAPVGTRITDVQNAASGDFLYNIELSPTRNLLRHQNTLQGDMFFVSGEGNVRMKSTVENQYGGLEVDEKGDYPQTNTLYYPIIASFEYPCSLDEFMQWEANKYGYFEFVSDDNIYRAYIDSLELDQEKNLCTFELILKS